MKLEVMLVLVNVQNNFCKSNMQYTCQKALSRKNNLIKKFFLLSFVEDEVPSDQEIIDVSFPVKWVSTQIRVRKVLTINYFR